MHTLICTTNSPRLINGFGESVVGDNVRMSLCLASWAENTDPQQHNDAMMNPWLGLVSKDVFLEMLNSKIPAST